MVQVCGDIGRLQRRAVQRQEAHWTAVRPWWELNVVHPPPAAWQSVSVSRQSLRTVTLDRDAEQRQLEASTSY